MNQKRLTLRARLRLAAVAAILIPAAVAATPAAAHDSLSSAAPARDAVRTAAPDTVSLTLSEPPLDSGQLDTSILTVTDGAGKTVSAAKVTVDGPTLSTKITAAEAGTGRLFLEVLNERFLHAEDRVTDLDLTVSSDEDMCDKGALLCRGDHELQMCSTPRGTAGGLQHLADGPVVGNGVRRGSQALEGVSALGVGAGPQTVASVASV
jgi:methionine-rich copper-binding protein CopC